MALPTLPDLKQHLNIPSAVTDDDDELETVLDAALEVVAGIVGPLEAETVTEIHRGVNSPLLVLRRMPAAELSSISARYSSTDTTALSLSDYELDSDTGIVRLVNGSGFYGTYVVEYTTGRTDLPASVRLAVLIVAAHLWETQRRPGFTSATPAGFGGSDGVPDASIQTGFGYAIPARAMELLRPYMTGPVIA